MHQKNRGPEEDWLHVWMLIPYNGMGLKPGHLSGFGGSSEVIWGGPLATSALCIIRGGIFASANLPIEIDNDMYSSKQDISGGTT